MNLWLYSDRTEQYKTAINLVIFGANTFRDAEIIKRIDELEAKLVSLEKGLHPKKVEINDFIFSYLIDTIKIVLFFENYFKAELIINNFCVHKISNNNPLYMDLRKDQFKRPINIDEINQIAPFNIDKINKEITHQSIERNTLGFSNLIASEEYLKFYKIDRELITFLKNLNESRNEIHFLTGLNFDLSAKKLDELKKTNNFVQDTLNRFMNYIKRA